MTGKAAILSHNRRGYAQKRNDDAGRCEGRRGVQSTVSMILNGKSSGFPHTTVENVLAAAAALQYNFRGAVTPAGDTVLVIATQLTNPFTPPSSRRWTGSRPSTISG